MNVCECGCGQSVSNRFVKGHNKSAQFRPTAYERFMTFVEPIPEAGCWLWAGFIEKGGYGLFRFDSRLSHRSRAHRVSWELFRGPIPASLSVLHHCDVRCCVNPYHLFVGTHADNTHDAMKKGRMKWLGAPGEVNSHAKVTTTSVLAIRAASETGKTSKELAKKFGIAPNTVRDIATKRTWKHV
jgi:hypothetical protein